MIPSACWSQWRRPWLRKTLCLIRPCLCPLTPRTQLFLHSSRRQICPCSCSYSPSGTLNFSLPAGLTRCHQLPPAVRQVCSAEVPGCCLMPAGHFWAAQTPCTCPLGFLFCCDALPSVHPGLAACVLKGYSTEAIAGERISRSHICQTTRRQAALLRAAPAGSCHWFIVSGG